MEGPGRSTDASVSIVNGLEGGDRSPWSLVLGLRFFALSVVAGAATFLPRDRVDPPLVVAGTVAAVGIALLQHLVARRRPAATIWFIVPHALLWTLMIHATGGQGSPLALGYLLELPLSGALFLRRGVLMAASASALSYLAYALGFGAPFQPPVAATLLGFIALCAGIAWHVVDTLQRQRGQIESSQAALRTRADTLGEELRLLGDYLGDALLSIDENGRIASVNPSGVALLGIDSTTDVGGPWQEVLQPDPVSRARLAETLESGAPQRGVTMVLTPCAGRSLTVRAEMWLGAGPQGRRAYLLLDPRNGSAADDPVRRLGESAACVAHQIKNSMHALQGVVQGIGPAPGASSSDQCLAALRGLGALADDVLAMAGSPRARTERVAIDEVLRSAVALLGPATIRMSLPPSQLYVDVRRSLLVHAIFNLLDNAIRMSPRGEAVAVDARLRGDWVVLDIADAGPGIPDGFATGEKPLPSRNGSGLGLMAARRFVEECGGRLSVAAMELGGTRCRVELPMAAS